MTVHIHMHLVHRQHTDGKKIVEVQGDTVGRALADLVRQYPAMEKELFDKKGRLHGHIEIYLNAESAFPGELERPVKPGDDIQIVTFLAGG
ncbi:MAG: MoaD/ThiS family protein [Desulfotignum sp.]|nr:MoaD/ThiS family protein [Desulfotignum sp.]MCF8113035.1 MoaD/ThiS family protein [Desulfotignum sp.]MCF8124778.1 MoaD/ThiS family protein [Desulfotignum sp.]